jgi:hypothetical protein
MRFQLTQAQFAAIVGVSTGHMSEVENGVASLSDRIKAFLNELFIDVETVEEKHNIYMILRQRQYRGEAASAAQIEFRS